MSSGLDRRLNTVYEDKECDDNTLLIQVLNTILESSACKVSDFLYFCELLSNLNKMSSISRPDVMYVVDQIYNNEKINTFDNFTSILSDVYDKHASEYKCLFLLCYCRAKFESIYSDRILYTDPKYAAYIAYGECEWKVFLEAFKDKAIYFDTDG